MGRTLRASAMTFSAREMTMNWPKCMGFLFTKEPWLGLDSTDDVYTYKGALLPVELSRRHPQIVFGSLTEGLNTLPWHWVKPTRSRNILPEAIFLTPFSSYTLRWQQLMTARLGRCCLYRAMVRGNPPFFCWMLHGSTKSLSGRSPFCQLKLSSRKFTGNVSL